MQNRSDARSRDRSISSGTPCRPARVHGRGEFCGALSRISILFDSIRVRARRTSRKPTFARTRIYPTIRPNGTDFIMPALRCGCKPERVDEAGARKCAQSTVNRIRDAKLLSQRICDAANGATEVLSLLPLSLSVRVEIMLINTVKPIRRDERPSRAWTNARSSSVHYRIESGVVSPIIARVVPLIRRGRLCVSARDWLPDNRNSTDNTR